MTEQAISTISYNTEPFLVDVLKELIASHIIQSYQYIKHKGEDGDKDHIHLRVVPNKRIDMMDLTEKFKEYVPNNKKPLCVRDWHKSKESDWILYAVHDKDYLIQKYGTEYVDREKIPYKWEDIKVSDGFDIEIGYIRARATLRHTGASIQSELKHGKSAEQLIAEGRDVMKVRAVLQTLQLTNYETLAHNYNKLAEDYEKLEQDYNNLIVALNASNISIEIDEDGEISVIFL